MNRKISNNFKYRTLVILLLFVFIMSLTACGHTHITCDKDGGYMLNETEDACIKIENYRPVITGDTAIVIDQFSLFDPTGLVTASDTEDGVLEVDIISSDVDTDTPGHYKVVYQAQDSGGLSVEYTLHVTVKMLTPVLANYPEGIDLTKLDTEQKAILFAACERYLLTNAYGGIPLYRQATPVAYSSRMDLFSENYNGVLGFGDDFSRLLEDDSTVLMAEGVYGNEGEYTFRSYYNYNHLEFNPWLADESISMKFNNLFTGSLYKYYFNETLEGFDILPELASGEPIPLNSITVDYEEVSTVWQIPIEEGLTWTFHPDIDTSEFPENYEILDANDYIWTYKTALDNEWFKAVSGGNDFISQGVLNALEYTNGSISFDEVGLKAINDTTLEITFNSPKSMTDVLYMFLNGNLSPINQELYETVYSYGSSPVTIASSGVYYLDTLEEGEKLLFSKNPDYVDSAMYHYTHQLFTYIFGDDNIFDAFLDGLLDTSPLPKSRLNELDGDSITKYIPNLTTMRLLINGFGTQENQLEYNEHYDASLSTDFVPEPILMYTDARLAFQFGTDRYSITETIGSLLPAYDLFTETYFLDNASGITVRSTEAGSGISRGFGGETYGYYPEAAVELFKKAVSEAIEDGYYTAGTSDDYTVIELDLVYSAGGNASLELFVNELVSQYESLLIDDENYVKIDIVVYDVPFPTGYYQYIMLANTDLSIGGISSTIFDIYEFLKTFQDDNVTNFTLNWGIDTTSPYINVVYENLEGEMISEMWGYNALASALNEKTYIRDGVIQTSWIDYEDLIKAYVDLNNEELVSYSINDGVEISYPILGDTLEEVYAREEVTVVAPTIVITNKGAYLYLIYGSDELMLHSITPLVDNVEEAIMIHSTQGNYLLNVGNQILDDFDVSSNEYLQSIGITTYDILLSQIDSRFILDVEFYEVNWNGWSDVYAVLHIGDYYIGLLWI